MILFSDILPPPLSPTKIEETTHDAIYTCPSIEIKGIFSDEGLDICKGVVLELINLVGARAAPLIANVNDGSCLPGPDLVSVPAFIAMSKMSEYEQLSRNSRLVEEKMNLSSTDLAPSSSSKILSIANMTDAAQTTSRPQYLDLHSLDMSNKTTVRQNAADILSPVTESATILSYIDKTSCKVQRVPDFESPVDMGLKNYLQERAAIRAKQNSLSVDGPEFPPNKIVIKEEQNIDVVDKLDTGKKNSEQFPHNYSHTDTFPQNVTMNVKDMLPIQNGASNLPPEFNIPHISKADSPMRKPVLSSSSLSASSALTDPTPSGVTSSGSDSMKIRTPDLESPVDIGLKNYLQEQAAIRSKQNSLSNDGPEFLSNKEEQTIDVVVKLDISKKGSEQFPHTDIITQNVTMNVKDMPLIQNGAGATNLLPEFNIPHISPSSLSSLASNASSSLTPSGATTSGSEPVHVIVYQNDSSSQQPVQDTDSSSDVVDVSRLGTCYGSTDYRLLDEEDKPKKFKYLVTEEDSFYSLRVDSKYRKVRY